MATEEENEWSVLAQSYENVLRPRFDQLYNSIASFVVKYIRSNNEKNKSKVLDYGTGPGEPILTILKMLEENKLFNVELQGIDSSNKMILVAKDRLNKLNQQHLTIQFSNLDQPLNSDTYDVITQSLVLPYASDKGQLLRDHFIQLKSNGILISSHWPHPNQASFLATIKRVVNFMATGEKLDISQLESNVSFSCWQEEITKQLFITTGFTIQEWISVNLPMSFPNIRALLSFCEVCPWFNDENLYFKAEEETKRILHEDYGIELHSDGSFQLPSTVIVVVASKSSLI